MSMRKLPVQKCLKIKKNTHFLSYLFFSFDYLGVHKEPEFPACEKPQSLKFRPPILRMFTFWLKLTHKQL